MFRAIVCLSLVACALGYGGYDRHDHRAPPSRGPWSGRPNQGGSQGGSNQGGSQGSSDQGSGILNSAPPPEQPDKGDGAFQDRINDDLGDVSRVREVFAWGQIFYNYGSESVNIPNPGESSAPGDESSFYIPYNNVPVGVDRWKDKVFITTPRRAFGIPATVAYVSLTEDANVKSPGLRPYPSLEANTYYGKSNQNANPALVSVYRPKVDSCDRLWLMDTGNLEASGGQRQVQQPAIVIYDLNTNRLIRRFVFPNSLLKNGGTAGFISLTVDTEDGDCNNAYAYVPDIFEIGLVIYSFRENKGWRMVHSYFSLDPLLGDFNVNGFQYQWRDGIFSVALSTRVINNRRITYALFHPMASYKEFAVSTDVLKNETLATRRFHFNDLKILGERGPNSQSSCHGIHPGTGVVFFTQVAKNAIACWNTHKPLNPANVQVIAQHDDLLFYPADLHVDNENEVWVISNKFPQYFFGQLNTNEDNFRVFRMDVKSSIAGTVCA